ncbi:MAG: hypothetical protein ACE5ID_10490, partial [Acidobacteriota bacterium]
HAGRDFRLIDWPDGGSEKFQHDRTGWPLEGQHATLDCADCHKTKFKVSPVTGLLKRSDPGSSWLGLETNCISCHQDPHGGALGEDCLSCHTQRRFKPAPRFDHARTDFPLTGQHLTLKCDDCHRAGAAPRPVYKPLRHDDCSSCHQDPHKGRLGTRCSQCHSTEDFRAIDDNNFDHDLTRYALEGRHLSVDCAACHDPEKAWGKTPPFQACSSCHSDPHAGKATVGGKKTDCAACHDTSGFKPSTFTRAEHQDSPFRLRGRHLKVACSSCHLKLSGDLADPAIGSAGVVIRMPHAHCASCHEDAHGGQLARRRDHGACESCHSVEGWNQTLFTAKDHNRLRLPLLGRHAELDCAACHGPKRHGLPPLPGAGKLGSAGVLLEMEASDSDCVHCHVDPHRGRFSTGGSDPSPDGCLTCHDLNAFTPSTLNVQQHGRLGFVLAGAHGAVPCLACHEDLGRPASPSSLVNGSKRPASLLFHVQHDRCKDCHASPHGSQFEARMKKGDCLDCHVQDSFKPAANFHHDQDSRFPLKGAHARVPCSSCHRQQTGEDKIAVTIFKGTPTRCEACHLDKPVRSLEAN